MKRTVTLLLMFALFSKLLGCSNAKRDQKGIDTPIFPVASYAILETRLEDDKPAIGSFNLGYQNYPLKAQYPWCLNIAIALDQNNLFENGFPWPEEKQLAHTIEDECIEKISKLTTAHYIGHLFHDEFLDLWFYLEKPQKVHHWLQTQINKKGLKRGFGYEINSDPTWETVTALLNKS